MKQKSLKPKEIVSYFTENFQGLVIKNAWGETSLFYNPEGSLPRGVYFCTIKESDGENDKASQLDREGVFRMSFGLPKELYEEQFGPLPRRPGKGGVVQVENNFTDLSILSPHPIYAWIGWVQILSPTPEKFNQLDSFFKESYLLVKRKYQKRASP